MDEKDAIIAILTQQRNQALNALVSVAARLEVLTAQVKAAERKQETDN